MEIMDLSEQNAVWREFYAYKENQANMRKGELLELRDYIEGREYLAVLAGIREGRFPYPECREINKNGVNRKRMVFVFQKEVSFLLKLIAWLLKRYDYLFAENLYSFREGTGVKKAISRVRKETDFSKAYCYKADIHDYFNSVNTEEILQMLRKFLPEEPRLIRLFQMMFQNPYVRKNGQLVEMKKGIMAGVPTAGFLADLYLMELDEWFAERGILYARYSDDIIVFSESPQEIAEYETVIKEFLKEKKLELNPEKETHTVPGEKIEFLGFTFSEHRAEVSDMTIKKMKDKLRRKARALYRWKLKKPADDERTAKAFIRFLNKKFYDNPVRGEITWCRWYFPVITDDLKLKILDEYAVQCIRYLYTGKHGKKNYDLRYEQIKELGFQSLVNQYWKFKKGKSYGADKRADRKRESETKKYCLDHRDAAE